MKRFATQRGMSLVELILVLGILALVATITAPRLFGFAEGREFIGEWNRLYAAVRYARSEAISRAIPVEIQFDTERRSYTLATEPGETAPSTEPEALEHPIPFSGAEHVLPRKLALDFPETASRDATDTDRPAGTVLVRFLPDGAVDEESPRVLRLFEEKGTFCRMLQQDPLRGYVPVRDEIHE